ncbi:hypothetical protein LguiB_007686 [Lonicera macranthoides]
MSIKLDRPVQSQMAAVPVVNNSCLGDYDSDRAATVRKPPRRRRVFVQTESGCVLGMELNRGDNAHTVKRRLHLSLNVPTDESSLTFGDMILNNDLSGIQNDSALLLTRNLMNRSSSSPSLSPTGKALQQKDQSGLVEILGRPNRFARTNELVKEIVKAIRNGIEPIPINSGLGGAYYFRNIKGESVAIVKPTDEEPLAPNNPKGLLGKALGQPGLKNSVRVGETGFREVAAYLLDHEHFANVPPTALIKISHSIFNVNGSVNGNKLQNKKKVSKIASLQKFIPHDFDASDHGSSSFPVAAVHRIGILDIRIFNTDRHAGNLLVRKLDGVVELIPIDHGLCLPESLEDPYFEWIHWPQASVPFTKEELNYISNLDPVHDSEMLKVELPMIREACLRVLELCTIFLKEAAAFGLYLADIGEMMSREFQGREEVPSELEALCLEVRKIIAERENSYLESELRSGDDDTDFERAEVEFSPNMSQDLLSKSSVHAEFKSLNGWNPLSELDEIVVNEEQNEHHSTVLKQSKSLKNFGLGEKRRWNKGGKPKYAYRVGTSFGGRIAEERVSSVTRSFVKFVDMNEEEWILFLEKFKELLCPAFANWRISRIGQRMSQRLGNSCQF